MKGSHPRPADRCPFVLGHSISQVMSFMQLGMLWHYVHVLLYNSCDTTDHSGYGLSQWEIMLHCNVVSYWLSPYCEWSLDTTITFKSAWWLLMAFHVFSTRLGPVDACWGCPNLMICSMPCKLRRPLLTFRNGLCFPTSVCKVLIELAI